MSAKHTPGPWDCWDMDEFGWHVFATKFGDRSKGQDCRLSIAAVRYGRSHHEPRDNYFEQVANAHMIAAAPDMWASGYAADTCLSLAYGYARELGKRDEAKHILEVQTHLRTALAKAEGKP